MRMEYEGRKEANYKMWRRIRRKWNIDRSL